MLSTTSRIGVFTGIVLACVAAACVFGMLHNQVSYSVSEEFFTRFKFLQFRVEELGDTHPRLAACLVGMGATWWVGAFVGLVFGGIVRCYPHSRFRWAYVRRAMLLMFITTAVFSVIGVTLGLYISRYFKGPIDEHIFGVHVHQVARPDLFSAAGSMHNLSYIGGLLGLLASSAFLIRKLRRKQEVF